MKRSSGTTLVELLSVLALSAILMGIAALSLRPMEAPLDSGARLLEGFLRQSRAKAMATTSAHRVAPLNNAELAAEFAGSCSDGTWTVDPKLRLELPESVILTDTSWSTCFTSRGSSSSNTVVSLWHPDRGTKQVEVLLGGIARTLP